MFGYDDNGPFKMLEHELDRRDSRKKWALAVTSVVITVVGILVSLYTN